MSESALPPIAGPKREDGYPDRGLDCEFAMEPAFQAVRDAAIAAGWTEEDVGRALIGLAHANYREMIEEAATETMIAQARATGGLQALRKSTASFGNEAEPPTQLPAASTRYPGRSQQFP